MDNSFIIYESTPLWILPAIVVAAGLAFLMYQKGDIPWSRRTNILLAIFRFFAILTILFLFLNPLVNQLVNQTEGAQIVIAVDNSTSVLNGQDSTDLARDLQDLKSALADEGFEVSIYDLDGNEVQNVSYSAKKTDLMNQLEKIEVAYEGRNLGVVLMLSDGIYNRGTSPVFRNMVYPVFTVGLGDISSPSDKGITEVNTNQVVYQGNKFPIEVLIRSSGYDGEETEVKLRKNGRVVDSKRITLRENVELSFEDEATESGLARYSVEVEYSEDERSSENNRYDFYVDVVEGKERILIVSSAPHPDIRAIRSALNESDNYETYTYIPGISKFDDRLSYDVVVVHHAFYREIVPENILGDPSFWYILGERSRLNQAQNFSGINLVTSGNQRDNVKPAINASFTKFDLKDDALESLSDYPTIEVPFGQYKLAGPAEVLLYQQIGSVVTKNPLFSFFDDGSRRSAMLYGSGIWKWSLQESALNDNSENFKQIILKTIQYLSVRNDKRKFRFEPVNRVFSEGDAIKFTSETYNDIYERISGNDISVMVTDEAGNTSNFNFVADANNNMLNAGSLSEGIYKYVATTELGDQLFNIGGEFLVKKIQLENLSLTADHELLKELSRKSGGKFYSPDDLNSLPGDIRNLELKSVIHTSQSYLPIINIVLILVIITVLATIEWGLRKYLGSY